MAKGEIPHVDAQQSEHWRARKSAPPREASPASGPSVGVRQEKGPRSLKGPAPLSTDAGSLRSGNGRRVSPLGHPVAGSSPEAGGRGVVAPSPFARRATDVAGRE